MPKSRSTTTAFATALFLFTGISMAQPETRAETEPELPFAAEVQDASELGIYKQRFVVTADVACRGSARRPSHCTAFIAQPILDAVQPEFIMKYSGFILDGQELDVEITPDNNIKFWTEVGVNYNGRQQFEIDLIYIR